MRYFACFIVMIMDEYVCANKGIFPTTTKSPIWLSLCRHVGRVNIDTKNTFDFYCWWQFSINKSPEDDRRDLHGEKKTNNKKIKVQQQLVYDACTQSMCTNTPNKCRQFWLSQCFLFCLSVLLLFVLFGSTWRQNMQGEVKWKKHE